MGRWLVKQESIKALRTAISKESVKPITLMEVCGSHTMAISRFGIRSMLPGTIRLISGPGCPVCVTGISYIDYAIAVSLLPQTIILSYGDLVRVPGTHSSLERERAGGADVRIVYSPMQALETALENPDKEIVFCGIGFETTTPGTAVLIKTASEKRIGNLSVLGAHKTMKPAMSALLESGTAIDGYICPGHVSVITGMGMYRELCREYPISCTVTGFEAQEILIGILSLVRSIQNGGNPVQNAYPGVVREEGNPKARSLVAEVFEPSDALWRGLGSIKGSGLAVRREYKKFDAYERFGLEVEEGVEPKGCRCGEVLRGICTPAECPLYGNRCVPGDPVGACMVSSEGSCAAWYNYS